MVRLLVMKTILLVEDEVDIREALAEALTDENYQVLTATNGQEGLAAALEHHPDLILLDIRMPIMTGPEMLDRLRMDAWGKDAAVVMLTAMDDTNSIASTHASGISDYIIKAHHSLDEIMRKVRESLHAG